MSYEQIEPRLLSPSDLYLGSFLNPFDVYVEYTKLLCSEKKKKIALGIKLKAENMFVILTHFRILFKVKKKNCCRL